MSMNVAESKARLIKYSKKSIFDEEKKKELSSGKDMQGISVNWRQEWLLHSNLSLNASCSSDASADSFVSRASTGRIGKLGFGGRKRRENVSKMVSKGEIVNFLENVGGKGRCGWVTPNTDPCYATFHDEEWGVPVHDDKKLFELLVLSSALAELSWPTILSKRHIFREVFKNFDPGFVSKLNEKKIAAPGSMASSLLSEPKLRAIIENSRQVLKIIEEFGSFDRYCWSFVNHKPIISRFRYSRQVPVKTPKADVVSKDLMRRGFRSVGPTTIYTFMQVTGLTNDHLISCFRFEECANIKLNNNNNNNNQGIEGKGNVEKDDIINSDELGIIDLELVSAVDDLSILSPS